VPSEVFNRLVGKGGSPREIFVGSGDSPNRLSRRVNLNRLGD
jgi:hypothetical protein